MKKAPVVNLVLTALFAALIAVGAFIRIPIPIVPFTLQTFFVMLAGMLLGAKRGAVSAALYMFIGLIGIPIFAAGGGLGYVLKPSFGYIIGFCFGAYLTGAITSRAKGTPSFMRLICAGLAGLVVIYFIGIIYFWAISTLYLGNAVEAKTLLLNCFLFTLPGDIVLCVLGSLLSRRLIPVIGKKVISES